MNKKIKILLLEDDTILAQTMVQILEQEDYDVTLVNDGEEVMEYTYENRYDLRRFSIEPSTTINSLKNTLAYAKTY